MYHSFINNSTIDGYSDGSLCFAIMKMHKNIFKHTFLCIFLAKYIVKRGISILTELTVTSRLLPQFLEVEVATTDIPISKITGCQFLHAFLYLGSYQFFFQVIKICQET